MAMRTTLERDLAVQIHDRLEVEVQLRAAQEELLVLVRARQEAERAAETQARSRLAAEQAVREQAHLAERAEAARTAAEQRALALTEALELPHRPAQTRAGRVSDPDGAAMTSAPLRRTVAPAPVPAPRPTTVTQPAEISQEPVSLDRKSRPSILTIVLGVGAGVAAAVGAQAITSDGLQATRALVALIVTVMFIVLLGSTRSTVPDVYLLGSVLHVDRKNSRHLFDLGNPRVQLEVVGDPEDRDWKVLFLRRGLPPYVVDARMVDPRAFTDAVREWRPDA